MAPSSRPLRDELPEDQSELAFASIKAAAKDDLSVGVRGSLDDLGQEVLRDMPTLLVEVSDMLRMRSPDYAAFVDANETSVAEVAVVFVQQIIEATRRALADLDPAPPYAEPALRQAFEEVGRLQWTAGRDLRELLSAYRDGARAAWRYVSTIALRLGMSPNVLAALGEAVLVFFDQLASASVQGYVDRQGEGQENLDRFRCELASLLLTDGCDIADLQAAAERADWVLPAEVALILLGQRNEAARAAADRLDRSLPVRQSQLFGVIVPGPLLPSRKQEIAAALRGAGAVVGESVPLQAFPASIRLSRIALELLQRGALDGDPVFVSEHLDTILVQGEKAILDALRAQVLAPLAELGPATRTRLVVTLRSWLRHMGDRKAVARELFIHPQTVRYRMGRLREYFGSQLDSPRSRAQMLLALEWDSGC